MKNQPREGTFVERDGKKFARVAGAFKLAREIKDGKTVTWLSVSSETPCRDVVYLNGQWQRAMVVLSHRPDAVDLCRLDKGLNLRDGHGGDQVAKLEGCTLRGGKLGGTAINWSVSERAQVLRSDYENGVRDDVSVEGDYDPSTLSIVGELDGLPLVRCDRWTPLAAALGIVTAADPNVGVNRSASAEPEAKPTPDATNKQINIAVPAKAPNAARSKAMEKTPEQIAAEARGNEVAEIMARCAHFEVPLEKTMQLVREQKTLTEVSDIVLRDYAGKKAASAASAAAAARPVEDAQKPIVGTTARASGRTFSIARMALAQAAQMKGEKCPVDAGFEIECSREAEIAMGRKAQGMYIPWDAPIHRAFELTSNGSNVVAQNLRPDLFVDYLYAKTILAELGVTMLPGLVGDILLPKQSGQIATGWVDETTAVAAGNPTMIQVKGSPHTAGAYCDITRQLMLQSTPAADIIVQSTLVNSLARTIQLGAFHGTGANSQPTGLFTALAAGYQSQAIVAAATVTNPGTFAELEALKAAPEEANVDADGECKWAMRPTAFRKLKGVGRVGTTGAVPIAVEDRGAKFVADNPCLCTSALTAGYGVYGKWSTMAVGMWGATDIIVDPYSLSTSGKLRIVALQNVDVMHRYLVAFGYATTFAA
jgi:HK97 family phage major capsid protein